MKNTLFFYLSIAVAVLFTSCSKKGIELNTNAEVILHHGETSQISAESKTPILYRSDNDFHASVNENGLITANFVGETFIELQNDYDTKKVKVLVKPKYFLYTEPNIQFGESRSSVIHKFGTPDFENEASIAYNNYGLVGFIFMVLFDESNLVKAYVVAVPTGYSDAMGDFLSERYLFVGYQGYDIYYANGITPASTTVGVVAHLYNTDYWWVEYLPYNTKDNTLTAAAEQELKKLIE